MRKQTLYGNQPLPGRTCDSAGPARPDPRHGESHPRPRPRWRRLPAARRMAQVERQFGAPTERFAAVGQPPITRWVYPAIVFFEYDHVVHAVALRR